jgi:hypothetical protein
MHPGGIRTYDLPLLTRCCGQRNWLEMVNFFNKSQNSENCSGANPTIVGYSASAV